MNVYISSKSTVRKKLMKFASIEVHMMGEGGMKNAAATLPHKYVDWAADVVRGGTVDVVGFRQGPKTQKKLFFGKTPPPL